MKDSRPNIFIADINRCPYHWREPEYKAWTKHEEARLQDLSDNRVKLKRVAQTYFSHEDRNVRNMAIFIDFFLKDNPDLKA